MITLQVTVSINWMIMTMMTMMMCNDLMCT